MENLNLNVHKNAAYREYKYSQEVSATMLAEYIRDGYFSTEDTDSVLTAERQSALSDAMGKLRARERLVLTAFANAIPGEPWLANMADAMDVSVERIKQIKDKALGRLHAHLLKKRELWVNETDTEEDV